MTPAPPTAPDIRDQGQPQEAPPSSAASTLGQIQNNSRSMTVRAFQELYEETGKIAESTGKIAQMADKLMPSLMGDIVKMLEVGKSMQAQVKQAIQQMTAGGSQQQNAPAPISPTDAPMAAQA
jgi:hypothetical protein